MWREPVPLSEHEQRLLEQMEQALSAEDPKFANALQGADLRRRYRRRAVLAAMVFVGGIAVLMTGAVSGTTWVGVAGFVIMLASAWYALTSWRRVPADGELGTFADPANAAKPGRAPKQKHQGSFMERLEERWRRRRENGPGGRF
jgi:hypothetical protein